MVRDLLRKLIYLLPQSLGVRLMRVWRFRKLWMRRLRVRLSASKSVVGYVPDNTVYWVDPRKIVFAMDSEGFYTTKTPPRNGMNWELYCYEYQGAVIGGDWDGLERRFSELDFYRSYEKRALKGTCWEQLPYYKRVLRQIENGKEKWGCKSKRDLEERCRMLDSIFNDIKQNGFKSRAMQRKERGKDSLFDEEDEMTVNIGRHGDLIFNNGRHRMTFAKIAGVERVPVKITARHSEWEKFVKEIETYIKRDNGRVYAPLTHIGLQRIPAHHDQIFEMIRRNVGEGNSTLLDIGARWGYFCHRFEEEGFHCTAVEINPENLHFLEKLRRAESRNFEVIPKSVFTLSARGPLKYDIILALDVLHHFLKDKASFEDLKRLLHCLDVNELYFEPHLDDESQSEGAFARFSPEEFVGFILENSCLNSYELIGRCDGERAIYKLWRDTDRLKA